MNNYNIYFLDYKNSSADQRYRDLTAKYPNVYRINLLDTLADTIRVLAKLSDRRYFWVTSSITDYHGFKFENYSEVGLEPYLQVFGANTWLVSKEHIQLVPDSFRYVNEFPDQHFVETKLKVDNIPLDIVYISNGEPEAEKHYQQLIKTVKTQNKIQRIKGVKGRTAAYQAAARASSTAWFFAVFAKLEVNPEFDWLWQPDTSKGPMHHIFHARNAVNGLEYGHMATVAYSKTLTLATEFTGLDFIMTKPHDVVPVLSGTAYYNQNPTVTWRTAFREALKLQQSGTEDALVKLKSWTSKATGVHGIWSIKGARDAVEYYKEVNGDFDQLLLSYDWAWLNQRFQQKYNQ